MFRSRIKKIFCVLSIAVILASGITVSGHKPTDFDYDPLVDLEVTVEIKDIRVLNRYDFVRDPDFFVKVTINDTTYKSPIWHNQRYVYGYFEDHRGRKHYFSCSVDLNITQADILAIRQSTVEQYLKEYEISGVAKKVESGIEYYPLEFASEAELITELELRKLFYEKELINLGLKKDNINLEVSK